MWLLSAARAELKFFSSPESVLHPGICVLSHTWSQTEDEQTFQEVNAIRKDCEAIGENPRDHVSEKIRKCCELAEKHGYAWVWIDTCCIDKTSSAELSEAINSMFRYYSLSSVCYVYLADVPADCNPFAELLETESAFHTSRWHTRGWTLQELIAPHNLLFFSRDWTFLGTKADLAVPLEKATRVPKALLRGQAKLSSFSIAQRMSWAAERQTSRKEDEAYCLLGIFDINMPTLYGEGANAFYRLQEEIMRKSPDTTIFAWKVGDEEPFELPSFEARDHSPLLADSPSMFADSSRITFGPRVVSDRPKVLPKKVFKDLMSFAMTPHGVLAHVPSVMVNGTRLIDLNWRSQDPSETASKHVYLALGASENEEGGQTLWHILECNDAKYAVYSEVPIEADWKMEDLHILARSVDDSCDTPDSLFPCNASADSPFHFRMENLDDQATKVFNVGIAHWTNIAPAVVEFLHEGRFYFHLTFGVCRLHTRGSALNLVMHWITACFGKYEECHACQNGSPHSCQDGHIKIGDSLQDFSFEVTLRLEMFSNVDAITCGNLEMRLRRHPWAQGTVIVESISNITLSPPLKYPLSYVLDPKTNRIILHTEDPFPVSIAGPPIFEGIRSVYLGSVVLFEEAVQPCRIAVQPCRIVFQDEGVKVLYSDDNREHQGYYYLLVFDDERMHWLSRTREQKLADMMDQNPVIGGWEVKDVEVKLFHVRAHTCYAKNAGGHCLGYYGAYSPYAIVSCDGVREHMETFDILCWKKGKQDILPSKRVRDIEDSEAGCAEESAELASSSSEKTWIFGELPNPLTDNVLAKEISSLRQMIRRQLGR